MTNPAPRPLDLPAEQWWAAGTPGPFLSKVVEAAREQGMRLDYAGARTGPIVTPQAHELADALGAAVEPGQGPTVDLGPAGRPGAARELRGHYEQQARLHGHGTGSSRLPLAGDRHPAWLRELTEHAARGSEDEA